VRFSIKIGQELMEILRGSGVGKSAITIIETEQLQLSPQQPFLFFFESEYGFLQQSFWHLDLCSVVSFLHLSPPQAHIEVVGAIVKTSNNRILSNMDMINFMSYKH
jgi:hypothetical protein